MRFRHRAKDDELSEFRKNRQVYEAEHQERLERDRMGEFALMHDGQLVDVFADIGDANSEGQERYGEDEFSIITIGLHLDLGALNPRVA